MSRISRLAVLVAALASLFAVLSSTADAATFTNSGSTAFTATGGSGTLGITSTGTTNLTCANSSGTGTIATPTFTSVPGSVTFNSCKLAGLETHVICSYNWTPQTFTALSPAVTDGSASVNCTVVLQTSPFAALCNITGVTPISYKNPSGTTKGSFTLLPSNTLIVSNFSGSSCSVAGVLSGTTRPGDLSEQTLTVTNATASTLGPVIASP